MALTQQIQRRLRNAHMGFDPYNGDLIRHARAFGERVAQFGDEHRKGGLVNRIKGRIIEFGTNLQNDG